MNKENRSKSLLKEIKNIIKKNPALTGIRFVEVMKFLCLEKWRLSNKKFFFIRVSLKIKDRTINTKKYNMNYPNFF